MSQTAATQLRSRGVNPADLEQLGLQLTVMFDPAMHGTIDEVDVRGINPVERTVLVVEGGQSGWAFDPQQTAEALVQLAAKEAEISDGSRASVYSLAARSSGPTATFSSAPRAQAGPSVRAAAVAGSFYPPDADQLHSLVTDLLGTEVERQPWPAALIPHAGLRYSGRIAAEVLKRIRFPETIFVIGPKHTPLGVKWAVAPHETWSLPGATMRSDPDLARRLCEQIPGLQLDAAAHLQEHAIEVELPLLARLAPESRVIGIALGGADLERCRQFAQGLAEFIKKMKPRPLLLISSDMNHFATEAENRRLDKMAISEMKRLDPKGLYETCTEHRISMCGMLPAVIVMETLRKLGGLKQAKLAAYGTSADVSGDKSRVVGYAGMLFA